MIGGSGICLIIHPSERGEDIEKTIDEIIKIGDPSRWIDPKQSYGNKIISIIKPFSTRERGGIIRKAMGDVAYNENHTFGEFLIECQQKLNNLN